MSRLTKAFSNGEYSVEPSLIYNVIRKLGKIEDRIEKEEENYIMVSFKNVKEEGTSV